MSNFLGEFMKFDIFHGQFRLENDESILSVGMSMWLQFGTVWTTGSGFARFCLGSSSSTFTIVSSGTTVSKASWMAS